MQKWWPEWKGFGDNGSRYDSLDGVLKRDGNGVLGELGAVRNAYISCYREAPRAVRIGWGRRSADPTLQVEYASWL